MTFWIILALFVLLTPLWVGVFWGLWWLWDEVVIQPIKEWLCR